MKVLSLELDACVKCPFYRFENVLKETMVGYDYLHACKKSSRSIVYAEDISRNNNPKDCIPQWCELPNKEKDIDNGMQKASSEKEEGLPTVPGRDLEPF